MKKNVMFPEWAKTENMRWSFWGWDPLTYYKRLGRSSQPYMGNSHWCAQWRGRLHSKKTIEQMAQLGINVAVTQFFKGFGLEFEKPLIDEIKGLIPIFHANGIKVLGYTQFRSIFYETFLNEEPRAKEWAQRKYDGSIRTWGRRYYRWAPCVNNKDFINYTLKVIDHGAKETGLDGFHFDNSYVEACYCDTCQALFREYLKNNITDPDRMGLTDFRHVILPPPLVNNNQIEDPLYQEWIRFRTRNAAESMKVIYAHVKGINPDLCMHSNPAFPRTSNWADSHSVHPYLYGKYHDLICAENSNFPSFVDNWLITQISAYKMAESCGYQALPASWLHNSKTGEHKLPTKPEQAKLSLAEPAVFGGCVGTNWALRTIQGDEVAIDNKSLSAGMRSYISFFDRNKSLFADTATLANIALIHSFDSFAFNSAETIKSYCGFEQILIQGNISYDVVFTEEIERIQDYKMIIVPNQACLDDKITGEINNFVKRGGKLILTGDSGRYDENFLEREANAFHAILNSPRVRHFPDAPEKSQVAETSNWIRPFGVRLPQSFKQLQGAVCSLLTDADTPAKLKARPSVVMALRHSKDRRLIIHLLNYDCATPAKNLCLQLNRKISSGNKYKIYDPENNSVETGSFLSGDNVLKIKSLKTYMPIEIFPSARK